MKRLVLAVMVIATLWPLSAFAQEREDRTLLSWDQLRAIINEVSGERAQQTVLEMVPYPRVRPASEYQGHVPREPGHGTACARVRVQQRRNRDVPDVAEAVAGEPGGTLDGHADGPQAVRLPRRGGEHRLRQRDRRCHGRSHRRRQRRSPGGLRRQGRQGQGRPRHRVEQPAAAPGGVRTGRGRRHQREPDSPRSRHRSGRLPEHLGDGGPGPDRRLRLVGVAAPVARAGRDARPRRPGHAPLDRQGRLVPGTDGNRARGHPGRRQLGPGTRDVRAPLRGLPQAGGQRRRVGLRDYAGNGPGPDAPGRRRQAAEAEAHDPLPLGPRDQRHVRLAREAPGGHQEARRRPQLRHGRAAAVDARQFLDHAPDAGQLPHVPERHRREPDGGRRQPQPRARALPLRRLRLHAASSRAHRQPGPLLHPGGQALWRERPRRLLEQRDPVADVHHLAGPVLPFLDGHPRQARSDAIQARRRRRAGSAGGAGAGGRGHGPEGGRRDAGARHRETRRSAAQGDVVHGRCGDLDRGRRRAQGCARDHPAPARGREDRPAVGRRAVPQPGRRAEAPGGDRAAPRPAGRRAPGAGHRRLQARGGAPERSAHRADADRRRTEGRADPRRARRGHGRGPRRIRRRTAGRTACGNGGRGADGDGGRPARPPPRPRGRSRAT